MAMRLLLTGIVISAWLFGCASQQTKYLPSAACSESEAKCRINIDVTDCSKSDGYTVTELDLHVAVPSRIEWTITSNQYRFREDIKGIDVLWGSGVFVEPQPIGHKKFSWRNKHKDAGPAYKPGDSFYYYINIQKDDGTQCAQFDPWITNY